MKKAVIIFPLVGMIIFIGIWWNYHADHKAKLEEKALLAKKEFEERRLQEARDRELAIKAALEAQEVRRKERAEKEAKEQAEREARQLAIENRDRAARERQKFSNQVDQLNKDLQVERDAIAALEERKRKAGADLVRVQETVRQAQANERNLLAILDRIAAADAARAAAEAAAAAASRR
jgi:colicin import membrane protein